MASVIVLSVLAILLYLVSADVAPGLDAGHPSEYLVMSFIACTLLLISLPLMWYFDIVRFPTWFTALIYANIYYYMLSLFFGCYLTIEWWGMVAHIISSMFVSSIVFIALCLLQDHSPSHVSLGSPNAIVLMQILIGICFGGIWEVMEGYIDIVVGQAYMSYGVWDMLVDLRADMAGALIMGLIFWVMLRRHTVEEIAMSTRLGFIERRRGP